MRIFKHILLSLAAGAGLFGCGTSSESITGSGSSTVATGITGKVLAEGGGGYTTARVCLKGGTCTSPDANGNYSFAGTSVAVSAARAAADSSTHVTKVDSDTVSKVTPAKVVLDTAYIIVGSDTLREIPIYSWSQILPTGYVVQRNAKVVPPTRFLGNTIQAVYWTSDSIANVVELGSASSTSYSGYLYTYYDSTAFANNTILFSWFARVKRNDSVLAYTTSASVKAHAGDIDVDSTAFKLVSKYSYVKGYSYVPADSSVAVYNATKSTAGADSLEITSASFGGSPWIGTRPDNKADTLAKVDSINLQSTKPCCIVDTAFFGAYSGISKAFTADTSTLNGSTLDSVIVEFNSDTTTSAFPAVVLEPETAVYAVPENSHVYVGSNRMSYHVVSTNTAETVSSISVLYQHANPSVVPVHYTNIHVWFKFK